MLLFSAVHRHTWNFSNLLHQQDSQSITFYSKNAKITNLVTLMTYSMSVSGMPVVDNYNNSNYCGEKFQTQDDLETHKGTNIVIHWTVVQHPVQVAPFLDRWLTYWLIGFRGLRSCPSDKWSFQQFWLMRRIDLTNKKTKAKTYIQRYSGYEAWICESWCQSMEKAKTTFCWALVHSLETMKQAKIVLKVLSFFITLFERESPKATSAG